MNDKIIYIKDDVDDPLSNYFDCDILDRESGWVFKNVIQYFYWKKAMAYGDHYSAQQLIDNPDPYIAYRIGQHIVDMHSDTLFLNEDTLLHCMLDKFRQNRGIAEELKKYDGYRFIYKDTYDPVWGCGRITGKGVYDGKNLVGVFIYYIQKKLVDDAKV